MPWVNLLIAALFQIGWTFSLKYMDLKKVLSISWPHFFESTSGTIIMLPFVSNVVFGLVNIYCFSVAIKSIPASTALAVWTGITLIGVSLVEIMWFSEPLTLPRLFFLLLILGGIAGLKLVD